MKSYWCAGYCVCAVRYFPYQRCERLRVNANDLLPAAFGQLRVFQDVLIPETLQELRKVVGGSARRALQAQAAPEYQTPRPAF